MMKDMRRITEAVEKVARRYGANAPEMAISKHVMVFAIYRDDMKAKEQARTITELKDALNFKTVYDTYEYSVVENDAFIVVTACLL